MCWGGLVGPRMRCSLAAPCPPHASTAPTGAPRRASLSPCPCPRKLLESGRRARFQGRLLTCPAVAAAAAARLARFDGGGEGESPQRSTTMGRFARSERVRPPAAAPPCGALLVPAPAAPAWAALPRPSSGLVRSMTSAGVSEALSERRLRGVPRRAARDAPAPAMLACSSGAAGTRLPRGRQRTRRSSLHRAALRARRCKGARRAPKTRNTRHQRWSRKPPLEEERAVPWQQRPAVAPGRSAALFSRVVRAKERCTQRGVPHAHASKHQPRRDRALQGGQEGRGSHRGMCCTRPRRFDPNLDSLVLHRVFVQHTTGKKNSGNQ